MMLFRILLIVIFICIFGYTGIVVVNHGFGLFEVFFGDIAIMGWSGQFNFDFLCFLILSALWVAWRHNFSPLGIVFGLLGIVGGSMFLAPYLLFATISTEGDMKKFLLGKARADS